MAAVTRVLGYPLGWLRFDLVADVTLAAYAVPVSLAYATLAGLPPQVGVYGYLLGGLGYALAGSSRYLAIGPTSAISLMIAGTVGDMAGDDPARYAQIASAAAFGVGVVCLIAWLTRLSGICSSPVRRSIWGRFGAELTIHKEMIDAVTGDSIQASGAPASRLQPTEPRREGRVDPNAVAAA